MFKKVISAMLVVIMVVVTSATAFAADPTGAANDDEITITNPIVMPIQILAGNLDSAAYGGVYYGKDGRICINVINEASVFRAMKKSNISGKDVILIKAKYSMKDLMEASNRLAKQGGELGLVSLGIDEKNNCVIVSISGTSKEDIEKVKRVAALDGTEIRTGAGVNIPTGGDISVVEVEDNISIPFKKGVIAEAYSFDYANRSYHKITDLALLTDMSLRLDNYTPAVSKDKNQVGFLVFTGKGEKYEYYLDSDEEKASISDKPLIELSKTCNEKFPASAQWLAFMSSSNIERITFAGEIDKDFPAENVVPSQNYFLQLDTKDKIYLEKIAAFLKTIKVSDPKVREHINVNPVTEGSDMYQLSIDFKTEVNYSIFGKDDDLTISSSYMNESISYKCAKSEIKALRDFMASLGLGIASK